MDPDSDKIDGPYGAYHDMNLGVAMEMDRKFDMNLLGVPVMDLVPISNARDAAGFDIMGGRGAQGNHNAGNKQLHPTKNEYRKAPIGKSDPAVRT